MKYLILIIISIFFLYKWIYWKISALAYIKYILDHTKEPTTEEHRKNLNYVISNIIEDLKDLL